TLTIKMKDGSERQISINAKTGSSTQTGSFAFIPDSTGQGFSAVGGIGQQVNAQEQFQQQESTMEAKRVELTFNGSVLSDLAGSATVPGTQFKGAIFMDRQQLPATAFEIEASGSIRIDPNVFFMAKAYQQANGSLPMFRIAYMSGGKLTVVLCSMSQLPTLPNWTPPTAGQPVVAPPTPDQFTVGQTVDLTIVSTEQDTTLADYISSHELQAGLPAPGQAPPPPNQQEQQTFENTVDSMALTFQTGLTLPTYTRTGMVPCPRVRPTSWLGPSSGACPDRPSTCSAWTRRAISSWIRWSFTRCAPINMRSCTIPPRRSQDCPSSRHTASSIAAAARSM
ncbi:MAG: hypothetical protein KGR26_10150, partial [Cyanobacteria bacterium REEB65]|nr:hypothetical protein [Cyanobacteria bacterium REEB65]